MALAFYGYAGLISSRPTGTAVTHTSRYRPVSLQRACNGATSFRDSQTSVGAMMPTIEENGTQLLTPLTQNASDVLATAAGVTQADATATSHQLHAIHIDITVPALPLDRSLLPALVLSVLVLMFLFVLLCRAIAIGISNQWEKAGAEGWLAPIPFEKLEEDEPKVAPPPIARVQICAPSDTSEAEGSPMVTLESAPAEAPLQPLTQPVPSAASLDALTIVVPIVSSTLSPTNVPAPTPRSLSPTPRAPGSARSQRSAASTPRSACSRRTAASSCGFNSISGSPAPGHYEDNQHALSRTSRLSHNVPVKQGQGTFLSLQTREGLLLNGDGDPGAYADHDLLKASLSARSRQSPNTLVREGKSGFTSKSPRGIGVDRIVKGPGAGEYSFGHLYACGEPQATNQISSSFKSRLPLAGHIRKSDTPGCGDYFPDQAKDWSTAHLRCASKAGMSCFAGGSPQHELRVHEGVATGAGVGPDTYEQDRHSLHKQMLAHRNPRLPGFASSSRRGDPTTWQ